MGENSYFKYNQEMNGKLCIAEDVFEGVDIDPAFLFLAYLWDF